MRATMTCERGRSEKPPRSEKAMVSVVIQAGGRSTRMGRDKALVPLGGLPLIQHVLARVMPYGDEILITTNNPAAYARFGLRVAQDDHPGAGALPGLHTALRAAQGETVLVVACDMPFIRPALLEHLLALAPQADVVVPRRGGRYEPLLAVYNRPTCLPAIEAALDAGERRLISFYPQVDVHPVKAQQWTPFDPEGESFFNVNTPENLRLAETMLKSRQA
jgi:molybdenum cofactor guanylyltransferase